MTTSYQFPEYSRKRPARRLLLRMSLVGITALLLFAAPAWAIRVKDVAYLRGARSNQLIGYGLVVGLDGTGDSAESLLARRPLKNALERMAISLNSKDIRGRSIAGVLVTAILSPFAKAGAQLDATVDTLGDATSLRGGTLMYTLLYGANQVIFATAQGPITGIPKGIERGPLGQQPLPVEEGEPPRVDPKSSLVPTKGFVVGGGLVEREINLNLNTRSRIFVNLKKSDFTTSFRLAKLVNRELGDGSARAKDAGTVEVSVPESYLGQIVELVSRIENLEIVPDAVARVVVDERTGTIVMGQHVRISPIAVSHGNLSIEIKGPLGQPAPAGQAAAAQQPAQQAQPDAAAAVPEPTGIVLFKGEVDLKEVVDGLNKIGASSSDLVQVLQIIKAAGALHADLEIR